MTVVRDSDSMMENNRSDCSDDDYGDDSDLFERVLKEGQEAMAEEPFFECVLNKMGLSSETTSFEQLVANIVSRRLVQSCGSNPDVCPLYLNKSILEALQSKEYREKGHLIGQSIQQDALACERRDPACQSVLEVVLFFKGFAALVCHRAARFFWLFKQSRFTALWLQSQASAAFGVDIHPLAQIGSGVMLDHATGIVIGETATIGDGCTLLHGVTLGGTGNEVGDRHPKVGKDVLIGAGAKILGNISLGDGCKIGAGSIVLRPVPGGATAVGVPAKIVGFAKEKRPGSQIDMTLHNVLHTSTTMTSSSNSNSSSLDVKSLSNTTTTSITRTNTSSSSDSDDSLPPRNNSTRIDNTTDPGLSISDTEEEETSSTINTKKIHNSNNNHSNDNDTSSKNSMLVMKSNNGSSSGSGSFPSLSILRKSSRKKKACMTASGTRKCFVSKFFSYQNSTKDEEDDICSPFRSFSLCKEVPKGAITYPELRSLLLHFAKATDEQAGEIFFSLLQKSEKPQVGYIYPLDVVESNFIQIAVHKVGLDQNDCQGVLQQIEGITTE